VVFTEAATGPYLFSPILAALGGAEKVYAVTADSRYGSREQVKVLTIGAGQRWGVSNRIEVLFAKTKESVGESDIITNSGFVRPIDREMISWMKPTAVVPLMWEPWEFRTSDLDLEVCREKEILVMGTDESVAPHSMYRYGGYLAMRLLFELGLEGYKVKSLLLGGGQGLGCSIHDHFKRLGMEVAWFSDTERESQPYDQLRDYFEKYGMDYDVMIVAEHAKNIRLIGGNGLLTVEQIRRVNPGLCIGVIAGNLDGEGLRNSGLHFLPLVIEPFGKMSYQPYELGCRPVLELYAAGLKVGEAMARARLKGMSIEETKRMAQSQSPAIDFESGEPT
jgi:hypothetical protein